MEVNELLEKYHPKNLPGMRMVDFMPLSVEDFGHLATKYPHMTGDLLIQKADGTGVKSPATYRSLYSLLKGGHKFKVVGTRFGNKPQIQKEVEEAVEKLQEVEFVAPPTDLFTPRLQPINKEKKVIQKKEPKGQNIFPQSKKQTKR